MQINTRAVRAIWLFFMHLLIPTIWSQVRDILTHVNFKSRDSWSPIDSAKCWPAQKRCAIVNNDNNKNAVGEPGSACTNGETSSLHVSPVVIFISFDSWNFTLQLDTDVMSDRCFFPFRYLKEFRTQQCPLFLQHKCTQHRPFTCFHWHFMNQRRRRPVRKRDGTFNYSPDIYCAKFDETTGICPDGDE